MRILLTGGTGYIGSNLLIALVRANYTVGVLVRRTSYRKIINFIPKEQIFETDGTMTSVIAAHKQFKPELVIHLAALVTTEQGGERIEDLIRSNITFGAQVLEGMCTSGCNALINTGSAWQNCASEQYQPVNLYGATKQAFEDLSTYYADALGFKIIHLYLFDTYGENDPRRKLLPLLKDAALTGKPLKMTPGGQIIYPVHVEDVCNAYIRAVSLIEDFFPGEIRRYAIRAEEGIKVKEVAERFNSLLKGNPLKVEFGGIPYRDREVMQPWIGMPILEGWKMERKLDQCIEAIVENIHLEKSNPKKPT